MDVVISARVPEDELDILKKKHVNISEIVRESIIKAAKKERLKEAKEALAALSKTFKKIAKKEFIKAVREDRDETH